jgi:hypothetical protein
MEYHSYIKTETDQRQDEILLDFNLKHRETEETRESTSEKLNDLYSQMVDELGPEPPEQSPQKSESLSLESERLETI